MTTVEAALVGPVIFLLIFAVFQAAFAMRVYISLRDGVAAGARADALDATDSLADYDALQAIKTSSASLASSTNLKVVVFYSNSPSGTMDPGCLTHAVAGKCNFYTQPDFARPSSDFSGSTFGGAQGWKPADRHASRLGVDDYVGIYIEAPVPGVEPPFPNTLNKTAIVQLQAISA